VENGRVRIVREGRVPKFVARAGQVTFSGPVAARRGQDVLYVTERCVFQLTPRGLLLAEVAPGIDVEGDILRHLPFRPVVEAPRPMDPAIFAPGPMGLRERLLDIHIDQRLQYDARSNTVYMNYAGMRVRSEADVRAIVEAVDRLLRPLGRRVYSVVNYERFVCDDDVADAYMDAVKYVEETYYLGVTRYTSNAFLRHKLGAELAKRRLTAEVRPSSGPTSRSP